MTVAALPATAEYLEDGITVSFPVPFRFKSATDLIVERIVDGLAFPLTLGVDYSVTGGATDAGGTLLRSAATSGATLRIRRDTARQQAMVYTTGDRFPAVSHEEALDRQMLIAQEQDAAQADTTRRAIMVPVGSAVSDLSNADFAAGGVLVLDGGQASTKPIGSFPPGPTGPANSTYETKAEIGAAPTTNRSAIYAPENGAERTTFTWTLGDYTGRADAIASTWLPDGGIITPISQGAWLPPEATSLTYKPTAGGNRRPAQAKIEERVTTSDYPTLQAAIDTGAREVIVNTAAIVTSDIVMRSNMILRFAGGKISVPSGGAFTDGVLTAQGGQNTTVIDPVIDASATSYGVPGIMMYNNNGGTIRGGRLTKSNILLRSNDNTVSRGYDVSGVIVDMAGYQSTSVYVSRVSGASIRGVECFNGIEGVGLYDAARDIDLSGIRAHGHTRDGFLSFQGQRISHSGCFAWNNGQSGFTTQRFTDGEDTRYVTWDGCFAHDNIYDGFDIRGAIDTPYAAPTIYRLNNCVSRNNVQTGYYIVNAPGVAMTNCAGILNQQPNLFINTSHGAQISGFRSLSGATAVPSGNTKAGILVFASNGVQIIAPVSNNDEGATQDYGVSFIGGSMHGRVVGGDLSNNNVGPFGLETNALIGAFADNVPGGSVYTLSVSEHGIYHEEGTGVPTHVRPLGSIYSRIDGGGPELYARGSSGWFITQVSPI